MLPLLESPSRFTRCLCRSLVTGIWFQVGDYWSRCSKWPQSCSLGRYSVMQYQKQWYLAKYFLLLKCALYRHVSLLILCVHGYSADIYIEPLLCARHSARVLGDVAGKDWQILSSLLLKHKRILFFHLIHLFAWGFGFPTLTREPQSFFIGLEFLPPSLAFSVLSSPAVSSTLAIQSPHSWSHEADSWILFFPKFWLMKSYVLIDFSCRFTLFLSLYPVFYCAVLQNLVLKIYIYIFWGFILDPCVVCELLLGLFSQGSK